VSILKDLSKNFQFVEKRGRSCTKTDFLSWNSEIQMTLGFYVYFISEKRWKLNVQIRFEDFRARRAAIAWKCEEILRKFFLVPQK
jgi:hypothetical protein